MNKSKEDIFKVGDRVKPVRDIMFDDGTTHFQEKTYEVNERNRWYFNFQSKDYFKVN